MNTIKLNVSDRIMEHVMFLLNSLPKSDFSFKIEKSSPKTLPKKDSLGDFFQSSPLVGLSIERNQEVYQGRIEF